MHKISNRIVLIFIVLSTLFAVADFTPVNSARESVIKTELVIRQQAASTVKVVVKVVDQVTVAAFLPNTSVTFISSGFRDFQLSQVRCQYYHSSLS